MCPHPRDMNARLRDKTGKTRSNTAKNKINVDPFPSQTRLHAHADLITQSWREHSRILFLFSLFVSLLSSLLSSLTFFSRLSSLVPLLSPLFSLLSSFFSLLSSCSSLLVFSILRMPTGSTTRALNQSLGVDPAWSHEVDPRRIESESWCRPRLDPQSRHHEY